MKIGTKGQLHPRNAHRKPYDFSQLIKANPDLAAYVIEARDSGKTIDFSDPDAIMALNRALLIAFYGINWWDIPQGCLCPPVPGRADYIHYLADLLATDRDANSARSQVRILDIGVGANCIYPIIGRHVYGWDFVGSDINAGLLASAQKIIDQNQALSGGVELRLQRTEDQIFRGIIAPDDFFDATMCNPPFHASAGEARETNQRRLNKMGLAENGGQKLNFGGQGSELWCIGGEAVFIHHMIAQSALFKKQAAWFSTLVSKRETLSEVYRQLRRVHATAIRTIDMAQGQKVSRIVAWSFRNRGHNDVKAD